MNEPRICDACKKEVMVKDHQYILIEADNKKEISRRFMHKICQEKFDGSQKQSTQLEQEMLTMTKMTKEMMKKMGAEEIVQI